MHWQPCSLSWISFIRCGCTKVHEESNPQEGYKHCQSFARSSRVVLGSVPYSTTIKTCKDTLFAFRSTSSGPKPGGVFHLGLRTWPPAVRPDFGVPGPFFLSFSTPCGRANGQVRKDGSCKINDLRMVATTDVFSSIGQHRKNSERKNSVKSAQQAVFCPHEHWRRHWQHAGAVPASTAARRWPDRRAPLLRAKSRRGSRPGCPEPRSSG